ncbi:MAG: hypothetical protein R3E61_09935 [Pseudomonadales bacterium]
MFEYEHIKGEPQLLQAKNINPYLVDAPDVVLTNQSKPICHIPEIGIGNKPIDDENHSLATRKKKQSFSKENHRLKNISGGG